jgi:hypothetical protein
MPTETTTKDRVEVPPDQKQAPVIVPATRMRPRLTLTVHPDTEARLNFLVEKFRVGRGAILDKLVATLYNTVQTKTLHCIHGHRCGINRTDVPEVF